MFTAIKLFFGTSLGRGLLIAAGVALVLIASYSMGRAAGHTSGFTDGRNSRNEEVKHLNDNVIALSNLINDERLAQHKKVKEIETEAANAAVETQVRLGNQIKARDAIIANYSRVVPISEQEKCGLDLATVKAINQLIDNVNGEQNESTKGNGAAVGRSDTSASAERVREQPSTEEAVGRRSAGTEGREGSDSGEDAGTLRQVASNGGTTTQPEGYADVHRGSVDALQRLQGTPEGRSGKSSASN